MISHFLTPVMFAGLALFFTVMLFGKMRLAALVKYYALSSVSIACFFVLFGLLKHGSESPWHIVFVASMTVIVKAILIPWVILYVAKRSGALFRLQSFIRQAPSYFVAMLMVLIAMSVVSRSTFGATTDLDAVVFVSVALMLLGITFMIIRRDILSQIIGFLVLENGISIFAAATVGSIPVLIEVGFFSVIIISSLIMTVLSKHVQELYGTSDTERLRELID